MSIHGKKRIATSKAEEVLTQSDALFRALIDKSSDIIVLANAQGMLTYISSSITHIMGYSSEELVGSHALMLVYPDDLAMMQQVLEAILQTPGTSLRAEYRLRCKDGSWRWFEGVGTNLLDDPQVGAIIGNFRDITERKQVEEALQAEELRFRMVWESASDAMALSDTEGRVLAANPAYYQLYGFKAEDVLGQPFSIIFPKEQQAWAQALYQATFESEKRDASIESTIVRADGTIRIVETSYDFLVQHGRRIAMISIIRDITERKHLEEALRQSKEQLEVILQNIADGISVQETSGAIMYMNEAGAKLCGYASPTEVLRAPDFQTQHAHTLQRFEIRDAQGKPFPLAELPGSRALRGEQAPQAIVQYYDRVSQTRRWSLVRAQPIVNEDGQVQLAVTIFSDITEAYEAEQRKDEFIGMASHELKTPITTVKGLTQLVKRKLEKQGATDLTKVMATIETQLNRLTKLVNELLDVSKIQAGRLDYAEEPIDIDELIQSIVDTAQLTNTTHTITVQGASHKHVLGDRDRLEQVFLNLISNAVKYSPQADTVAIRITTSQEKVIVRVQDFGVGIPQEHRGKIFERFYRVADDTTKGLPGLGMGLYISSEIVKRHGGEITVESEEGKGSLFTVSLPVVS